MPSRRNQKARKKTTNEIGSDRISDLPKSVIDYILEKLEIEDVVRTSVLSKKWRHNWISLPQLVFSDQFTHRYKDNGFEFVISSVLFQHIGPIPKFSLTLHSDMQNSSDMIIPWLCFLKKNGIIDLTLDNMHYGVDKLLILPSYLFSCSELRVLSLGSCLFKTPSTFNGFRSLTSFSCHFVTFEGVSLESLLHRCPLLQELNLCICNSLGRVLCIESPNLRVFDIHDCHDIEYITFKNTQNLSSLSISLEGHELPANERKKTYISEFFKCFRKLENLTLGGEHIVQMLSGGVVPKRLPNLLNFLKYLKLEAFDFCNFDSISCLLCILRSSPNLQLLEFWPCCSYIKKYSSFSKDDKDQILSRLEQQLDFLDCSLDRLPTIKVMLIYGSPPEMLVIKFLLATSPSLKKMVIQIYPSHKEKALSISKELLRFRRASTSAEVTLG